MKCGRCSETIVHGSVPGDPTVTAWYHDSSGSELCGPAHDETDRRVATPTKIEETWIIENWISRRVFNDKTFGSFEEARSFIQEHANATGTTEDEINGICEDLYAVEVMDPLDAITIETREQAHDFAVHWQHWMNDRNLSYSEMADWSSAFETLAEKFDLADEFRENAVI